MCQTDAGAAPLGLTCPPSAFAQPGDGNTKKDDFSWEKSSFFVFRFARQFSCCAVQIVLLMESAHALAPFELDLALTGCDGTACGEGDFF